MKNVLFIIPFLGRTGAERVILNLINNIDRVKYKPHLLLYSDIEERNSLISQLNSNVPVFYLNVKGRARYNLHRIIYGIRKCCFENNIDTLLISDGTANAFLSPFLFLMGRKVKKIARESNLPSLYERNSIARLLYGYFYKNYDSIIVQSNDMMSDLVLKMKVPKDKIVKINNPLDYLKIQKMSLQQADFSFPKDKINLLTIGRLTYQKGYDLLLTSFSNIKNDNYHLTIIGTGEDKSDLLKMTNDLQLSDKVTFIPSTDNPYAIMKQADVFISSSRWEGYPNVVIESLACGTPVLANNYPGGINEIIDGTNGVICSLTDELFDGLEKIKEIKNVNFDKNKILDIYREYESLY
ncbi:glycosyltransferase [Brenneria izbisi]|uniref:Glycosyltransferase n=1 Tax=Brenneria izbisi TaxID=2939450 RepID=A0AA42C2X0_9GAMM|nr:glycosyltransferase [Brenneria izbisi]MCV9878015.1 glycosyltransferase [Brenneria izbisi]MCV9881421.1 glycosyltransferase [Brenneria izbisi]